ncbi:MAG: sporulation protein YunB, partial [Clostridia bacterium]|nr:sporulation protein YunB [Clostridia bacterium]
EYGINNALVEIGIHLEMTAMILLPFSSGVRKMTWDIPVIVKIVQGSIPNYYSNGFNTNSGIVTIPME